MLNMIVRCSAPSKDFLDHGTNILQLWPIFKLWHPVSNHLIQLLVCFCDSLGERYETKDEAVERKLSSICQI